MIGAGDGTHASGRAVVEAMESECLRGTDAVASAEGLHYAVALLGPAELPRDSLARSSAVARAETMAVKFKAGMSWRRASAVEALQMTHRRCDSLPGGI